MAEMLIMCVLVLKEQNLLGLNTRGVTHDSLGQELKVYSDADLLPTSHLGDSGADAFQSLVAACVPARAWHVHTRWKGVGKICKHYPCMNC